MAFLIFGGACLLLAFIVWMATSAPRPKPPKEDGDDQKD